MSVCVWWKPKHFAPNKILLLRYETPKACIHTSLTETLDLERVRLLLQISDRYFPNWILQETLFLLASGGFSRLRPWLLEKHKPLVLKPCCIKTWIVCSFYCDVISMKSSSTHQHIVIWLKGHCCVAALQPLGGLPVDFRNTTTTTTKRVSG